MLARGLARIALPSYGGDGKVVRAIPIILQFNDMNKNHYQYKVILLIMQVCAPLSAAAWLLAGRGVVGRLLR